MNLLETQKSEYGILHELEDRIADSKRMLKWLETSCQEEESKMHQLLSEKIRLKRLVKQFKDNDEENEKINRTVQNKITNILLDGKDILRLALYSLMESMKTDSQKYSKLIHNNKYSSARNMINFLLDIIISIYRSYTRHMTTPMENTNQNYWKILRGFIINW